MPSTTQPDARLDNPAEPAVAVVYALPEYQSVVRLALPPAGMTAGEAIAASGLCDRYPEIARNDLNIGIFGKPCELSRVLKPGDRVEIYRQLRNDPRAMRRSRAAAGSNKGSSKGKPGATR